MAVLVTCNACGAKLRVRDEYLGKAVWCPSCKAPLTLTGERVPNHEVFVSYSNKDKAVADAICATLEEKQIRCWIAPRDISAGNSWGGSIIEAIEDAQVMVLVYSGHSNLSPQIIREVERAVAKGLLIVPFRIEAAPMSKDMEYFLSSSHWFDALTPPLEKHLAQFAEMVRLILFKSAQAKAASTTTDRVAAAKPRASTLPWKGAATALIGVALAIGVFLGVRQYQQQKDVVIPSSANLPGAVRSQIPTPAGPSASINAIASTVPAEAKTTPASANVQATLAVPAPTPVVTPTVQPRESPPAALASESLRRGLVLYFSFDNIRGERVVDESGAGNNGTLKGGPTVTPGVVGSALAFNGEDAIVTVPHSVSLNLDKDMTLTAWIRGKRNQPSLAPRFIDKSISPQKQGFVLDVYNKTGYGYFVGYANGKMSFAGADFTLDDQWHHLAGSFDGTELRCYLDGVLRGTAPLVGRLATSNKELTMGNGFDGEGWHPFRGAIDEAAVFNRALSNDEVRQLYELGKRGHSLKTAGSSAPTPAVVAPPPAAPTGQQWTNSLGMIFVPVPGTAVRFSIWETRVQDYQVFVAATGRSWLKLSTFSPWPAHPVLCVSWDDAKAFCEWLTEKERRAGTLNSTQEYRLPMDAEWSTAVGLQNERGNTPKVRQMRLREHQPGGQLCCKPIWSLRHGGQRIGMV